MIRKMILAAFLGQIALVAALPGIQDRPQPHVNIAPAQPNSNASLVDNVLTQNQFLYGTAAAVPLHNNAQWRLPDVFKRQVNCVNFCGPTQSAPATYCGCGLSCCANGRCCNTASGQICCGASCCINGATCVSNSCMARTVTLSVTGTSTTPVYRDTTTTVTAVGGTVTITSTFSSVTIVTISTADVATVYETITSTLAAAKKARNAEGSRPADVPEPPFASQTVPPQADRVPSRAQDVLAPVITPMPGSRHHDDEHHIEKRQALALTTTTRTVAIVTVTSTIARTSTVTANARATATLSTTVWQTVTSVVNAKKTTTSTTTLIITPNAPPKTVTVNGEVTVLGGGTVDSGTSVTGGSNPGPSQSSAGGGSGGGGGGNSGQNGNGASANESKGLSKGAQIGIGAGTGAGSLIICVILGFWCWRRRKSRNEKNQEMIQDAVTSAMAAQQAQQQQQQAQQRPLSYFDKHLSTTTYSTASPLASSPSPPLHAPQPSYVYPPPPGHQQPMYNSDPMNFPEAMGSQPRFHGAAPLYGSEIEGSPVQRYELPQFASPPPQPSMPHIPSPYSDLPEVRR